VLTKYLDNPEDADNARMWRTWEEFLAAKGWQAVSARG
jgi:DNA transposition AAA+ family ATPase